MYTEERIEASILKSNTILIVLSKLEDDSLIKDFCGSVFNINDPTSDLPNFSHKNVYLCGDISKSDHLKLDLKMAKRVLIIREISHGYDEGGDSIWSIVDLGRVPILVNDVGVYYRGFFDSGIDYFNKISIEHTFQSLTESNKSGKAYRTGIYLTPVEQKGEELHFRLLRCSTNFSGATENFRANDKQIVNALNQEAESIFQNQAPLNHVLAQIYPNIPPTGEQKQVKAKIQTHADKTKDMPGNGIMAFCTFYDGLNKLEPLTENAFDYGYKSVSGLTKLKFRLKKSVVERSGCTLSPQFSVTLYPNSVFFMPLSTNRLYTHEIKPSVLDAEKLPTRLGYVVRCSSTEAVHKGSQTFLKTNEKPIELEPSTPEDMLELRKLYAKENKTDEFIDYDNKFLFSMNKGDYITPDYKMADEFCQYNLPIKNNPFEELQASARFENVTESRQGTVLVKPDEEGNIPIVRTTTKYDNPAQCFRSLHMSLANQIQERASLFLDFNNALIEKYTNAYAKMGFHSDQALDLQDDSEIAIFSCYKYPENSSRKLIIESKELGNDTIEIPLIHNSVVVFSLDTNRRFKHKIVLDKSAHPSENEWLGVTFRTSKTFVRFLDEKTYFEDGKPMTLADEDQKCEFYSLRRCENKEAGFIYPEMSYTISESDMMPPEFV